LRREGITRLAELLSVMKDAETGERGFIITTDAKFLEPFNRASERLPAEIEELRRFPWIDINAEEIGKILQVVEQRMDKLRNAIELRRGTGFDAAAAIVGEGSGKELMDQLRAEVSRLQERQTIALRNDADSSDRLTGARTLAFL